MSRKIQNTLFITMNLITILTFNTLLFSCDELAKSTISKKNIQIEITSEPEFFSAVKETLDSFDNGIFVSFDYVDPEQPKSYSESKKNKKKTDLNFDKDETYDSEENYEDTDINEDFDSEENYEDNDIFEDYDSEENYEEDYYANYDSENEDLLEAESMEELDLEFMELEKELDNYNPYDKSEEELKDKLLQISVLVNKLKKGLNEDSELLGADYEAAEPLGSQEDEVEYYDEDDQNAVLRENSLKHLEDLDPENIGESVKRNIKRLSLWTMFNMETEVKFNLNSVL